MTHKATLELLRSVEQAIRKKMEATVQAGEEHDTWDLAATALEQLPNQTSD